MAASALTTGTASLVEACKDYFNKVYQIQTFSVGASLDQNLSWTPTLSFKISNHLVVAVEVSERPYPLIFRIRRADLLKILMPIAVYSVCPEESYLGAQTSAKALMNDGFGLITVAADGTCQRRSDCIPLIQQINDEEFRAEIKVLPGILRTRLAEAFDKYKHSATSGVTDITEVMEGQILKAGREAAKKGWISAGQAKPGNPAGTLAAMNAAAHFTNCSAAIGSAHGYINIYRNSAHHPPKNAKQAATKYRDCRHAFIDGLKKIKIFRDAMRGVGLSGGI